MNKIIFLTVAIMLSSLTAGQRQIFAAGHESEPAVSGSVVAGYRVLPIRQASGEVHFTVLRGDYIKFQIDESIGNPVLIIPALSIQQELPRNLNEAPHFKMTSAGTFAFSLGNVRGDITVVEYQQPSYKEVQAQEAVALIRDVHPLILDVRTPAEYQAGHLKDAVLIPVQELQKRWKELSAHQDSDILIYCATGNRSTVASKILIDHGFKRIFNLRHGIAEWRRDNYPIVR
jgi:rhodanese-related sulfurtransferase